MNSKLSGKMKGIDVESQQQTVNSSQFTLENVNLLLIVTLLLVITFGSFFSKQIILGGGLMETTILLVTLGWMSLQGMDFKSTLRLRFPSLKEVGLTLIIITAGIYVASFIDQLFQFLLQNLGSLPELKIPRPHTISELMISLTAMAVLPALAEETLFRGLVLKSYERFLPTGKAILISSLLFGMAHLSIYNFWGPFILGLLCGWLVFRFNSIFLAIIGHLLNNALTITVFYYFPDVMNSKLISKKDLLIGLPSFVVAGVILLILLLLFARYKPAYHSSEQNKGALVSVFKHWSIWILFLVFAVFSILELLMMRGKL